MPRFSPPCSPTLHCPAKRPRTALSLLEVFEPALSSAFDVLDALDLLQSLAPLTYDSSRLVTRAFGHALEGVTDARLETLRREFRAVGWGFGTERRALIGIEHTRRAGVERCVLLCGGTVLG